MSTILGNAAWAAAIYLAAAFAARLADTDADALAWWAWAESKLARLVDAGRHLEG
jgi:hypothetical protein